MMEKQLRNVTLDLIMNDPTLETVSALVGELRKNPNIVNVGIRELESPNQNFQKSLETLINRFSKESDSNTPDYMLASFLMGCLENWNRHIGERDKWHSFNNADKPLEPTVINPPT